MSKRPFVDWLAARQAFVTSDMTLKQIAQQFGCSEQSVRRRSMLDRWADARMEFRRKVNRKADALHSETRAAKLHAWNQDDYKLARAIRSRVAGRLNKLATEDRNESADEIRTLAGITESTQRIARLALGATTANQGSIDGPNEDGTAAPTLGDFYSTVKFEGDAKPAPAAKSDDDEPTKH